MHSFTVALALVASIADASYYGSHSRQPEYSYGSKGQHVHSQYYNPHQKPVEETYVQPHVNTHRYGSHDNKTQYDRRYPNKYGDYNHGGLLPKYESPHSHLSHRHTQTTDPWGVTPDGVDTTGWWSPHKQFSPPLINYKPADLNATTYAICDPAIDGVALAGTVEFAQDPHRPAVFRSNGFTPSVSENGADGAGAWRFDIFTTGQLNVIAPEQPFSCTAVENYEGLVDATTGEAVGTLGRKFNPLEEVKNGVTNPYADPARGVLADVPSDDASAFPDPYSQQEVLINLGGNDSIIGRAIVISDINTVTYPDRADVPLLNFVAQQPNENGIIGCCIIALMAGPEATLPPADQVWQQSVHTQWHAMDPQHEQHTHDYPTGPSYGNSPAPQNGHSHGSYNRYGGHGHGHQAYY